MTKYAAILAVGTELTTGQITNRNSAWISEKLTQLGIEVVLHEVVADDRPRILDSLERCASQAHLIFVTGGLGPTTDDFTREVIAQWANLPLEFDEPSWSGIVTRLSSVCIPVAESNRQQCYFPKGAEILTNPEGTAAGFAFTRGQNAIWVLPGPPNEVAAIWNSHIEKAIQKSNPEFRPKDLFTWQCMGKSEAELGELTEKILEGSRLQTGYRAHRPFVEIKVWCNPDETESKKPYLDQLEKALSPWLITKNGEDLASRLLKKLSGYDSIDLIDQTTGGILAQRLGSLLQKPEHLPLSHALTLVTEWKSFDSPKTQAKQILEEADPDTLTLVLTGPSVDGTSVIGLRSGHQFLQTEIQSPYRHPKWIERTRLYTLEMALKIWSEWILTQAS